jgi:hypothetical protein
MLPETNITEHHTLVEASQRAPKGVICLPYADQYKARNIKWTMS